MATVRNVSPLKMIVSSLIVVIGICAIFQPTKARKEAALLFICITMLHELLFYDSVGLLYYGTAAFFDGIIIFSTANLTVVSGLTRSIHRISIVSMVFNFSGWIMWRLYLLPSAYNMAFVALYVWAVIVLIMGERESARGARLDRWAYYLRFTPNPRGVNCD